MYIRTHASEGVNVSQSYIIRTENFHSSFSSNGRPFHTGMCRILLYLCHVGEGRGKGGGGEGAGQI